MGSNALNAFDAVMDGDLDYARDIIETMGDDERHEFWNKIDELRDLFGHVEWKKVR